MERFYLEFILCHVCLLIFVCFHLSLCISCKVVVLGQRKKSLGVLLVVFCESMCLEVCFVLIRTLVALVYNVLVFSIWNAARRVCLTWEKTEEGKGEKEKFCFPVFSWVKKIKLMDASWLGACFILIRTLANLLYHMCWCFPFVMLLGIFDLTENRREQKIK